jgi:hypothetical protein
MAAVWVVSHLLMAHRYYDHLEIRHRSEQNFTSSHTFSHFFLHVKGLPQTTQAFWGRSDFFTFGGMG